MSIASSFEGIGQALVTIALLAIYAVVIIVLALWFGKFLFLLMCIGVTLALILGAVVVVVVSELFL